MAPRRIPESIEDSGISEEQENLLATYGKPFIKSVLGFTILFFSLGVTATSYLLWANTTPHAFGNKGTEGLFLKPLGSFWPNMSGFAFILAISFFTTLSGFLLQKRTNSKWLMGIIPAITYFAILNVAATFSLGIGLEGRDLLETPIGLPEIGVGVQLFFIYLLFLVYSHPLVPQFLGGKTDTTLYNANQWRKAQVGLSIAFAGVIGASIPTGSALAELYGPRLILLTMGLLMTSPLSITLFYILRLHYIEKIQRDAKRSC